MEYKLLRSDAVVCNFYTCTANQRALFSVVSSAKQNTVSKRVKDSFRRWGRPQTYVYIHTWQSRAEIEHYSSAYFDSITVWALQHKTHTSSAHNRSSALQWFECGNAVETHNAIIFHFYLGLPHTYTFLRISFIFGLLELQLSMTELCSWHSSRNGFQSVVDFIRVWTISTTTTHPVFHLT